MKAKLPSVLLALATFVVMEVVVMEAVSQDRLFYMPCRLHPQALLWGVRLCAIAFVQNSCVSATMFTRVPTLNTPLQVWQMRAHTPLYIRC
jgi:hypothetical protein